MAILHANSELVAVAWLKTLPGIGANAVGTIVPHNESTWSSGGFIQVATVGGSNLGFFSNRGSGGGSPNGYFRYRRPIITAHCWAVNPNKQNAPWGKANDLAESIMAGCWDQQYANAGVLTLAPAGAPQIRVLQANALTEPKRAAGDAGNYAHYLIDFQLFWIEVDS